MSAMRIYICMAVMLLAVTFPSYAQSDKSDVRRGNRDFRKENYREAEIDYRKALVKDSLSVAANYNLANTLYREGDMEQAFKALERIKDAVPETAAADYWYNRGDVAVARQDWQGAVDAFRQSLLLRPDDIDAKENYIYAKKKLQDQQNQQNQQNQQDQQDQQNDQNGDGQNQDQQGQNEPDDQNKDEQNKYGQDQQNPKQDQQNPQQGQQPKITPQAAQQMLQAIQAKEKETQDKVNRQKAEALKSRQKDKNW